MIKELGNQLFEGKVLPSIMKKETRRPKDQKTVSYFDFNSEKNGGEGLEDTLFERKTLKVAPKIFKSSRPELRNRKVRSDKKNDIKFKLSVEDKRNLKLKALEQGITSLTYFSSQIIKRDLVLTREYKDYEYDKDGKFVHAALENDSYNVLMTMAAEWGLSFRKTAHRIIKEYLAREYGAITIKYYNDER